MAEVKPTKLYSVKDLKQHTTEDDCWIAISGRVYDVTHFLDEHPGGFDIIVTNTGKDATEDFEEIGHSNAAKEMLAKYLIGDFDGGDAAKTNRASISAVKTKQANLQSSNPVLKLLQVLLPLLVILAAIFVPKYLL
ncbi:cytochrome b5 [Coccomyxa subellipsoidea C-169]|uniref:Cytochrome b5 n=1 Tax=Coccomyxa subellipsoidea (strain C-169) TaxID=574566 RepID=I0YJU7_COCSC|nr:cytochrome b5 [Coccomyxa subellipsoidea C-169]EIE18666.1 cytochrome b5 [Coccomyxa subellipsoidea C-169]|eukprot:XP_005643210.1 cytochrome b5 [Coccomyxa subellipsoidea C-169]